MAQEKRRLLEKMLHNIDVARHQLIRVETKRSYGDVSDEYMTEAARRFLVPFIRARGYLPQNPLASRDEVDKALREWESSREYISKETYEYIRAMLVEIDDLLGKQQVAAAITKMQAIWDFMMRKAYPPPPSPPYVVSPFPEGFPSETEGWLVKPVWMSQEEWLKMTPCAVCGRRGWDEWAVSDEEWKRYVPLEYQDKEICRVCYERFKQIKRETKSNLALPVGSWVQIPPSAQELKSLFGSEFRNMIFEGEREGKEVGAMLCQSSSGELHLSRVCWGVKGKVHVTDCHDHLKPYGSFHVHLYGGGVFSPTDLEQAIDREQLSCIGYVKAGGPMLKYITPHKYYEYPPEARTRIRMTLNEATKGLDQLKGSDPNSPGARKLAFEVQNKIRGVEQLLGVYEIQL